MADQVPTATSRVPDNMLQAILLADSFDQKFHPITLERPKVLLPLKNRPMIDYTLSWLESSGVDEVYVFCCAHSDQIIAYLDKSGWVSTPNFRVVIVESLNVVGVGDALRLIHKRNVIHGDFVLIGGDTVTNISLKEALQAHKDNRNTDKSAIMTMLIEDSSPSILTRESSLGICETFMAIDPHTNQLLYYDPYPKHSGDFRNACRYLRKKLLVDKPYVRIHQAKQDCCIDICSPQLLSLFTDNIDYQHPRGHLVKRLLEDDVMGHKIFTHEIGFTHAKRVDNFRSYGAISKSIYQSLPDRMLRVSALKEVPVVIKSHSAQINCCCVIGKGTRIGNYTKVVNSVIGQGCVIGSDVSIQDCYIWNNVVIEDGCKLKHALICDGAVLKSRAVLNPGVVLSFNVVIGQGFVVPAYSKVSLLQQPIKQDGGKELNHVDKNIALAPTTNELSGVVTSLLPNSPSHAASEVGAGGIGYIWSVCGQSREEERRHSVAPMPSNEVRRLMFKAKDDIDFQEHVYHKRRPFRLRVSVRRTVIVSKLPRRLKSRYLKKLAKVTPPRFLPGRRAVIVSILPRRSKSRTLKKLTRVTPPRFLPGQLRKHAALAKMRPVF